MTAKPLPNISALLDEHAALAAAVEQLSVAIHALTSAKELLWPGSAIPQRGHVRSLEMRVAAIRSATDEHQCEVARKIRAAVEDARNG